MFQRLVLRYLWYEPRLAEKLKPLNPLLSHMEKVVSKICKDKLPSRNDLLNLEKIITNPLIQLAIDQVFFPTNTEQSASDIGTKTNQNTLTVSKNPI